MERLSIICIEGGSCLVGSSNFRNISELDLNLVTVEFAHGGRERRRLDPKIGYKGDTQEPLPAFENL